MRQEQRNMNTITYRKCFEICDEVRKKHIGKKIDVHDYPASVVSCADCWANHVTAITNTSGKVNQTSYQKTPELEKALTEKLGRIGSKRNECHNYIGACAEPHAAREVMLQNTASIVDTLVFSYAYRPRTKMVMRYCKNCTEVFNIKNP
jgi:hypothetical protein